MKSFDQLLAEYRKLCREIKSIQFPSNDWTEKATEIVEKQDELRNHPDYPKP